MSSHSSANDRSIKIRFANNDLLGNAIMLLNLPTSQASYEKIKNIADFIIPSSKLSYINNDNEECFIYNYDDYIKALTNIDELCIVAFSDTVECEVHSEKESISECKSDEALGNQSFGQNISASTSNINTSELSNENEVQSRKIKRTRRILHRLQKISGLEIDNDSFTDEQLQDVSLRRYIHFIFLQILGKQRDNLHEVHENANKDEECNKKQYFCHDQRWRKCHMNENSEFPNDENVEKKTLEHEHPCRGRRWRKCHVNENSEFPNDENVEKKTLEHEHPCHGRRWRKCHMNGNYEPLNGGNHDKHVFSDTDKHCHRRRCGKFFHMPNEYVDKADEQSFYRSEFCPGRHWRRYFANLGRFYAMNHFHGNVQNEAPYGLSRFYLPFFPSYFPKFFDAPYPYYHRRCNDNVRCKQQESFNDKCLFNEAVPADLNVKKFIAESLKLAKEGNYPKVDYSGHGSGQKSRCHKWNM